MNVEIRHELLPGVLSEKVRAHQVAFAATDGVGLAG